MASDPTQSCTHFRLNLFNSRPKIQALILISMAIAQEILQFWFGDPSQEDSRYQQRRQRWFGKSAETDQEIRDRFLAAHQQAMTGAFDSWQDQPLTCLALLVLLDQFSRNLFRDTPAMFAADAQALGIAKQAIARQFDQQLEPLQRIFVYLPLEHSENLQDQQQSVALFEQLNAVYPEAADTLDYAIRHRVVIERFGRFPHRNKILGRETTPAEAEFLTQPGSSF